MRAKDFLSEQKHISESLDKPYPIKLEKSEFNDYDFIARLDDGTPLHIMITFYDPSQSWLVEFYRDDRQDISNTGDAFRVFATVLAAIEKVIEEENPNRITFFAEKTEDGHDAASRIKLYNRLVQRHASDLGYNAEIREANSGQTVMYILTRKQDISESTLNEFAAFHGTFRPSLARFKPLSHFGTYESAEERLHHLKTTDPRFADVENGYIYELDLGIQNPGVVKDYPEIRDPGPSSMKKIAVWSKDLLRDPRFSSYTGTNPINRNPNSNGKYILKHFASLADSGYWADFPYTKFISLWINFLRDVGLDGLVYSNKVENVGSKSFITFDPDQIQIKGKPKKIKLTADSLNEKLIPSIKPIDYPPLQKSSNGWWTTTFRVGTKLVALAFQNTTGMPVNLKFAKLLKPEYLEGDKFTSFYDIGFAVGNDIDDLTDVKNTGAPLKEARQILKAVAYIIKEAVYSHRSQFPFLYFWARPGENRESLYAALANELDDFFKSWGYVRLNPATALAHPDNSSHLWVSTRVFNDWSSAKAQIQGVAEEEVTEKWSAKYKRSINCNNPKGFSQRAHCQGRKKGNK